jgi:hypothetical protein
MAQRIDFEQALSVFLNIVLLSATGWFANRDSRSKSLVCKLKRNLEQLENQLTTGIDRAGSLRRQIQSVADTNAGTYRAIDTGLDIAEDLGRIVENTGRAIDRSAERTERLRACSISL